MKANKLHLEGANKEILLICDNADNVSKIEHRLTQDMSVPWNMTYFVNMPEAIPHIHNANIVIVDLALEGIVTPKEIFRTVQNESNDLSIIVLTARKEHNFCVYVLEKFKGGIIVKRSFHKLVDAIEFSLNKPIIKIPNNQRSILNTRDIERIKVKRINTEKDEYISWMNGGGYSVQNNKKSKMEERID